MPTGGNGHQSSFIGFMLFLVVQEIQCLQEKFDNLTTACSQAISQFTEEEGEVCLFVCFFISEASG